MASSKIGTAKNGQPMHHDVGAVIERDGKLLLIERQKPPLGFACPAGHIDEGEDSERAVRREVLEETGLTVVSAVLLYEEELDWNWCRRGVACHMWSLYRCETTGEIRRNAQEARSIGWYVCEDLSLLPLEPVWVYWLKKMNIISL